jgi:SAM-dependent methyltransferase
MNLFGYRAAARRYTRGRPYFHPKVIARVGDFLKLPGPVGAALDVGCGSGLSALALAEIARGVVGVDASAEMVALAPPDARVSYAVAQAEVLPFGDGTFELLTASQAFHWFDRGRFLREARRVLRPGAHLVVYDHYFAARMEENERFRAWFRGQYLGKYPSPKRGEIVFSESESEEYGFRLLGCEHYDDALEFTPESLIDYLTTHSNVIAAVEGGGESIDEARAWLAERLAPLFAGLDEATFLFRGPIWYLEKMSVVSSP